MKAGVREPVEIAGVVEMEVGEDDVFHVFRREADLGERGLRMLRPLRISCRSATSRPSSRCRPGPAALSRPTVRREGRCRSSGCGPCPGYSQARSRRRNPAACWSACRRTPRSNNRSASASAGSGVFRARHHVAGVGPGGFAVRCGCRRRRGRSGSPGAGNRGGRRARRACGCPPSGTLPSPSRSIRTRRTRSPCPAGSAGTAACRGETSKIRRFDGRVRSTSAMGMTSIPSAADAQANHAPARGRNGLSPGCRRLRRGRRTARSGGG